ncbi:MAG: hypothetical protein HQK99_01525 [Nitrospirae bacterium]|nr:hypothetical protein [Nitrospirota bacterium]
MIIYILCNYQQKGVKLFIREILERLSELVPEETLRGKYIRQIEVLSQLMDLQDEISKEAEAMALVYDLERDIRFRQGREMGMLVGKQEGKQDGKLEGLLEGLLEGIEGMLELKYGSSGLELTDKVRAVDSIDKLEEFKSLIKKAGSLDAEWFFWGINGGHTIQLDCAESKDWFILYTYQFSKTIFYIFLKGSSVFTIIFVYIIPFRRRNMTSIIIPINISKSINSFMIFITEPLYL